MGDNAERLGENCFLWGLFTAIIPCIPIGLLRGRTRKLKEIDGDTCGDFCAAIFCPCCASVQIANELDTKKA